MRTFLILALASVVLLAVYFEGGMPMGPLLDSGNVRDPTASIRIPAPSGYFGA